LSASPALSDYVTYVPPSGQSGNDIIKGLSYEEGHLANGIQNSLFVPVSAGGSGANFLDRLKLRFQIQLLGSNVPITEDVFNLLGIAFRDGRVRVIRELRERISLGSTIDFPLLILYYPYSTFLSTGLNLTNLPVPVNLLRQSFDFAPNVSGAKWYNQNVTNAVTVDAMPDNLSATDLAVVNSPNLNWYMLSSAHGSFVNIFALPEGLGTSRRFYYHDAPTGTNDGTTDTGTNGSWGDSGLLATATNITGSFTLFLTSYMLGKDQPREVGETLRNQTAQPLQANVQPQNFTTGVKETIGPLPQRFGLRQNYPNPVPLVEPSTLIRYEIPWSDSRLVELRIYNLLGQKVRELVNAAQTAGNYEVRWDGLENGELAPAGIYFYQLRAGDQIATRKLVLLSPNKGYPAKRSFAWRRYVLKGKTISGKTIEVSGIQNNLRARGAALWVFAHRAADGIRVRVDRPFSSKFQRSLRRRNMVLKVASIGCHENFDYHLHGACPCRGGTLLFLFVLPVSRWGSHQQRLCRQPPDDFSHARRQFGGGRHYGNRDDHELGYGNGALFQLENPRRDDDRDHQRAGDLSLSRASFGSLGYSHSRQHLRGFSAAAADLPPAIQTAKMEIRTFEGPLSFDGAELQAKLLQSLTPLLVANATDTTRLKLVRAEARKTVAEFVRTWLLQRGDWGEKKIENIKVVFREELGEDVNLISPADSLAPEEVEKNK
jgi:hypothetical protein